MVRMKRRSFLNASVASVAVASLPKFSSAQTVSFMPPSYTPDDLKGQLTPFGAVRAGNADGSIPAWTGANLALPAGYENGTTPQYFTDEKPLFIITRANYKQYQDKLTHGIIALFQKHAEYRVEVFQTHRTAIAPQYVYDYIYKNATNAKLSANGNSITNAYGGIPFPIPKNGHEVIWNHELAWSGVTIYYVADSYDVTPSGERVLEATSNVWHQYPYYFENGESQFNGFYFQTLIVPTAPPYEAGASILSLQPVNQDKTPVEGWVYLAGERRVRRAPELQYDTPQSLAGGETNWDEVNVFSGKQNLYDFEYVGIKEMFIPYNTNKACEATVDEQYLPKFFNPALTRWELHRVRVVEATVKAGARNVDARRTIYCDEDTGSAIMGDVYDASGSIWKAQHVMPFILPDVPCLQAQQFFLTYDLHSGGYAAGNTNDAGTQPQSKRIQKLPDSFFTPGHLASSAGGF